MVNWKPEGRKKRGLPRGTWKDGIYTAMNERDIRMGEWNNRMQWNMKVGRRHQTFQNRAIYIYIYIKLYEKQCELENWSVKEKNVLLMSLHIRLQRL